MPYNPLNWYWIVAGQANVWSSAAVAYVPVSNSAYQAWLAAGNIPTNINSATSLAAVLQMQWQPAAVSTGINVTSTGGAWSATFALDNYTMEQVGTMARDSAAGLGLPGGVSSFAYPDINGSPVTMTATQLQNCYKAMRDYINALSQAMQTNVLGGSASLPANSATIS